MPPSPLPAALLLKNPATGLTQMAQLGSYVECPASTDTPLGDPGAIGDYLDHVTVFPAIVACGDVVIKDGTTTIATFPGGGTAALVDGKPFDIPVRAVSVSGQWSVTCGASVAAVAVGKFS